MATSATRLRSLDMGDDAVRSALHSRGMRVTPTRLAVLRALGGGADVLHLDAQELHDKLTAAGVEIDVVTVYRALTALTELRLIHRLAIPERPATHCLMSTPHHHAICTICTTVTPIPASHLHQALALAKDVSPVNLTDNGGLTLHGLCAQCEPVENLEPITSDNSDPARRSR